VPDLSKLQKFLDDQYRATYLDSHVKGSVAYQIQALREKLGLNQTDFGALIGMPQSVISRLESGEGGGVNVNTLLKIANGLKIGLAVRFCNFASVLDEDVSPAGLLVESVSETINRLSQPATAQATYFSGLTAIQITASKGTDTWQTETPNPASNKFYLASGTPNFGSFMQTSPLLGLPLTT
jgi:transcriptional regulator with XRE-family HTH domain